MPSKKALMTFFSSAENFEMASNCRSSSPSGPCIEEELNFLRASGCLYYEIQKPKEPEKIIGDFVYFIRAGQMLARSKITGCRRMDASEMGGTYTGVQTEKSCWRFEIKKMERAKSPIQHKGFQGLRYVTAKELPAFERAFKVRCPKKADLNSLKKPFA